MALRQRSVRKRTLLSATRLHRRPSSTVDEGSVCSPSAKTQSKSHPRTGFNPTRSRLELNIGVATGGSESSMNMCLHPPGAHTTRFTQHRVKYWPSEQKSLNEIALMPLEYIWYGEQSDFGGSLYPYFWNRNAEVQHCLVTWVRDVYPDCTFQISHHMTYADNKHSRTDIMEWCVFLQNSVHGWSKDDFPCIISKDVQLLNKQVPVMTWIWLTHTFPHITVVACLWYIL